ncbi:MAG: ABC transporter ATP-binding protein [Planctomycetota bacterium]|jgi:ABC-2 type transport system ATP-binding protein
MVDEPVPILAEGLTREFRSIRRRDRVLALDRFDLRVTRGEVVGLLGPNGSGKSTTMKLLLGLIRPTSGRASLFGRPAGNREALHETGYLPEESRLFGFLTAKETLRLFGSLAGLDRRAAAGATEKLLGEFGLADVAERRVAGFSKGMSRRLGLAAALVGDPPLLILDEPTSGLDPLGSAEVKALIKRLGAEGRTVLLSSHLLSDVEDVCDRIVLLGKGRLISDGAPGELLALRDEWEVRFKGGEQGLAERVGEFIRSGGGEEVLVQHPTEDLESLFLRVFRGT